MLCQVLYVVPSRYYAWRKGAAAGAVAKAEPVWETALVDVFDKHQHRYSACGLQVELRELEHHMGRHAVRTALRRHERQALQSKAYAPHHVFDPRQTSRPKFGARPAASNLG